MSSFRKQWPSGDQAYIENMLTNALDNRIYLAVPFWGALLSIGTLLVQGITTRRGSDSSAEDSALESKTLVTRNGGSVVFAFKLARILGCGALVGLSVPNLMSHIRIVGSYGGRWDTNEHILVLLANVYALILAVSSCAVATRAWDTRLIRHNIAILLAELAIYTYRDLWPLVTYTKRPLDQGEGWLIWAKIGTLVFTAILIPLFIPSVYTPVDPQHPEEVPHPEQTASFLSFHTYGHLTPIVKAGYKVVHLPASELPSLPDYDRAQVLTKRAEPYLDPIKVRKGQHIFFGLLKTFGLQYFSALVSMTIHTITQFMAPIAVNELLKALEPSGKGKGDVRPWFWIATMLVSPLVGSMASQYYHFTMTRALADSESILTQLVFDYSLKVRVKAETAERQGAKVKAKSSSFIGKLNNLVTIDLRNIGGARDLVVLFWVTPVQMIGCTIFLYYLLGWSTFVGIGLMAATLPIPGWLTKVASGVQKEKMKKTDDRTQTVTESMNVLRMIKMFGWERKIQSRIDERREEELKYVWKGKVLEAAIELLTFAIPTFTMLATYATATLVMKMELTSAKVFSSMIVFGNLREHMVHTNFYISNFVRGKVSLDRLNNFFKETDLLDAFDEATPLPAAPVEGDPIGFRNASFSWTPDKPAQSGSGEPTSQFKLTVPGELTFRRGKINLIVGATGYGKTSLLMALLGEMHFESTHLGSGFTLPRGGGVSFCVQESWVQNETIKDNILFGLPYDEERYRKVLYQCALERDLELFEAGDKTEVGERGLTLSGGQKARLTLARAIYAHSDIILLDDVLAALDVHTASWIVKKCFQGDLVRDRTVLLVSHNVALCNPIADFIVSVSSDGVVTGLGNDISAVPASDPELEAEFRHDEEAIKASQQEIDPPAEKTPTPKGAGKLIVAEEIKMGAVGWKPIGFFFNALGGQHVRLFFVIWLGASALEKMMHSVNVWFLGYWSSQYDKYPIADVPVLRYTGIYALLLLITLIIYFARDIYYLLAQIRASRTIHRVLSQSILGTTLRWLDETPASRVIQRLTADIDAVDGVLTRMLEGLQRTISVLVVDLASAVLFVPMFTLPGLFIAGLGMWIGSVYMKAQMSVRREMSNAKAPMLSHFGAAASGLVSLRAYGAQASYRSELRKRLDHYVRLSRMNYDLNRWISFRIDFLGAMFTASLAAYLTYFSNISAANVGFSLNRAVEFCSYILWVVRIYNQFQVQSNNLERIVAYTEIEQEPKPTKQGKPPAAWPTSGEIQVDNLRARYSKSSPEILHGLSFDLRAGERVGVVGRTGSGKSSLTLALLRCILTDGAVYFDGMNTGDINLDALRSAITIIPQIPELLSGTLRYNLDPFNEYDDATLNAALRASGLYSSSQTDSGETRFTLDNSIASGGSNVSVGQRQIIALARAIIRSSKLLILDEATSAIDHETDTIIQNTLRRELGSDVTVLTIAHRLQTIIDADRILVMDAGEIASRFVHISVDSYNNPFLGRVRIARGSAS